jgi:hypothetical protein
MCDKPYTSNDKWTVSIISGLLFLLVASPFTYSLTESVTRRVGLNITDKAGCPNLAGLLIHALIYTMVLRLLMSKDENSSCMKKYTSKDKWIISMIGGLMFLLIGSPFLYEAVDALTSSFGLKIADSMGCPNLAGVVLHSVIFMIVTRVLMR